MLLHRFYISSGIKMCEILKIIPDLIYYSKLLCRFAPVIV